MVYYYYNNRERITSLVICPLRALFRDLFNLVSNLTFIFQHFRRTELQRNAMTLPMTHDLPITFKWTR